MAPRKMPAVFYGDPGFIEEEDYDSDFDPGIKKRKSTGKRHESDKRRRKDLEKGKEIDIDKETSTKCQTDNTALDSLKYIDMEVVNSPKGAKIQLRIADILAHNNVRIEDCFTGAELKKLLKVKKPRLTIPEKKKTSLDDLPFELLQTIYRDLFVSTEPVWLSERKGLSRSAALLQTCRKIHNEGTTVLYSENSFHFNRVNSLRGQYWEENWSEIGYKDVKQFLSDIGPYNVAKLKFISIVFEDALPTYTPTLTREERRFVNDHILIEVLGAIANNAVLEKFAVGFRGKNFMTSKNCHFYKALSSIRCYEFMPSTAFGPLRADIGTISVLKKEIQIARSVSHGQIDVTKRKAPKMMQELDVVPRRSYDFRI